MEPLLHGSPPVPWSVGATACHLDLPIEGQSQTSLHFAVPCRLGTLANDMFALVDTGAEWSVIGGAVVDLLGDDLDDLGEEIRCTTRLGLFSGRRHRLSITLLADVGCGEDLYVSATVLVLPKWSGPVVLGFRGYLEWIRFAHDPGLDGRAMFYFGWPT